jgi:hypothetical protein
MKPTRITIPDSLKSDLPQTRFGKILGATPVVMAVVATMLAGLASSEMTRAQYVRSLGAQQQSKAGDQWSFFQAKRVRSAIQRNSADMLQTLADVRQLDPAGFAQQIERWPAAAEAGPAALVKQQALTLVKSPVGRQALELLQKGELPAQPAGATALEGAMKAAVEGVENSIPDAEMRALLTQVSDASLEAALKASREQVLAFDVATKPVNQVIDQLDALLARQSAWRPADEVAAVPAGPSANRHFMAARLRYAASRYEWEARLNQTIANLYELQVRKSNIKAEHHHKRSQQFFFGMLAAQAGVIMSTFAMAARKRNLLWSLAAGAGLLAVAFAIYVYLYV